jgi:hypothetical protein
MEAIRYLGKVSQQQVNFWLTAQPCSAGDTSINDSGQSSCGKGEMFRTFAVGENKAQVKSLVQNLDSRSEEGDVVLWLGG